MSEDGEKLEQKHWWVFIIPLLIFIVGCFISFYIIVRGVPNALYIAGIIVLFLTFLFTFLCLSLLFKKPKTEKIVKDVQTLSLNFVKGICKIELDNLKKN